MKLDIEFITKIMKTIYNGTKTTVDYIKDRYHDDFGNAMWCGAEECGAEIAEAVTKLLCEELESR